MANAMLYTVYTPVLYIGMSACIPYGDTKLQQLSKLLEEYVMSKLLN